MRRLLKYLRSVSANRTGAVPRPSWCTYLVTFRCNARCGFCDSWKKPRGRELTVDEVDSLFARIGQLDVVRLSGGEPFLRKDLPGLARAVLRRSDPLVIHVTTNGSMPAMVRRFVDAFPKPARLRFMISFDGLEEEHNRSRGPAVTYRKAMETVSMLAEMGRTHGCGVSTNHTVVTPQGMRDHRELRRRLSAIDVDMQTVLAYSDSGMYGSGREERSSDDLIIEGGYPLHPNLEDADTVGFIDDEIAQTAEIRSVPLRFGKRYYLRGLRERLAGERAACAPRCVALRSHLRLMPDGSAPVCQFNTATIGNLADNDFDAVWKGKKAEAMRRWVDRCPGCWAECEAVPNALYTGDMLASLMRRPSR